MAQTLKKTPLEKMKLMSVFIHLRFSLDVTTLVRLLVKMLKCFEDSKYQQFVCFCVSLAAVQELPFSRLPVWRRF